VDVPTTVGFYWSTLGYTSIHATYSFSLFDDAAVIPNPLPVTLIDSTLTAPLWVSEVYNPGETVTSTAIVLVNSHTDHPVWISKANFQGRVNTGVDTTRSFHGTIDDVGVMIRRPSRSEDTTYNIPGAFGALADTNVVYSNEYQRKSLLDKLSLLYLFYSGSLRYKVKYPLSIGYTTLGASLPLLQTVTNTPTLTQPYNHIEMGMAVTDQATFSMLEFEHPFESVVPLALTGVHTLTRPVPLMPLNHGGENLDSTPLVSSLFEHAAPDFSFYGLLPPPNRVIAYKITGKKIFI